MSWEYKRLDELGTISRGKSKHRPRNDPSLFGGKYPFIQTADVKNANFYITEYTQTYSEKGLAQSRLWEKGTLCITIAANIADTGILYIDACFPDSIMGFIPYKDKSDVRYVKYCFDILQKQCQQISQGATQDNLSWEKLSTIRFPVPSLEKQKRIADILFAYDELIENNQKQIKLLEEAAQRLYKEWFVDLHFPGHETTPIVDEIPQGWKYEDIDDIYLIKYGKNLPTTEINSLGEYPVYGANGVIGYYDKYNCDLFVTLITSRGNGSGDVSRTHHMKSFVTNNSFMVFPKESYDYVGNEFTYLLMKNTDFKSVCTGSAQPQLTNNSISTLKLLFPSQQIVISFCNNVHGIFGKIEMLLKQNQLLSEARDRLLPKLMSGEIEV